MDIFYFRTNAADSGIILDTLNACWVLWMTVKVEFDYFLIDLATQNIDWILNYLEFQSVLWICNA